MLSISGVFSVTFSVVFAYVADVTTEEDRSQAYGLVHIPYSSYLHVDLWPQLTLYMKTCGFGKYANSKDPGPSCSKRR